MAYSNRGLTNSIRYILETSPNGITVNSIMSLLWADALPRFARDIVKEALTNIHAKTAVLMPPKGTSRDVLKHWKYRLLSPEEESAMQLEKRTPIPAVPDVEDTRDFTAYWQGDPKPGRSALDMRKLTDKK